MYLITMKKKLQILFFSISFLFFIKLHSPSEKEETTISFFFSFVLVPNVARLELDRPIDSRQQ